MPPAETASSVVLPRQAPDPLPRQVGTEVLVGTASSRRTVAKADTKHAAAMEPKATMEGTASSSRDTAVRATASKRLMARPPVATASRATAPKLDTGLLVVDR